MSQRWPLNTGLTAYLCIAYIEKISKLSTIFYNIILFYFIRSPYSLWGMHRTYCYEWTLPWLERKRSMYSSLKSSSWLKHICRGIVPFYWYVVALDIWRNSITGHMRATLCYHHLMKMVPWMTMKGLYIGTCIIWHTKRPWKCVGL